MKRSKTLPCKSRDETRVCPQGGRVGCSIRYTEDDPLIGTPLNPSYFDDDGRACVWLGRYDEAHAHVREALRLLQELGDQTGQADSHMDLGAVFGQQGR